jgi:histidyl-tRNA synthetase
VKIERPRGTHDILPSEQPLWAHVTGEAERLCGLYGYRRIQTPVFEDTALFQRTSGEGSDVVQKEMYTFEDRGGRSLTLRPEGTAAICRAYLEHGLHREPQPQKLFTITTMYRYAAPQKGRYREHWHLSVEAIGSEDPALDAELIQLYDALLRRLGVRDYRLALNSIGDGGCRPAYLESLRDWLAAHERDLDDDTRAKARTSPLRVFDNYDAKPAPVRAALDEAPKIGESLCVGCREHFAAVRSFLDAYGVAYELEPTLVRGLDYYTRTTWEFVGPEHGAQSTISGGGRYDGLIEQIGGKTTPGVGFGAGIERLLIALEETPVEAEPPPVDVFFAYDEATSRQELFAVMAELRRAGLACEAEYAGRSLKGQMTHASRLRARHVVVVSADGATVRREGQELTPAPVPVREIEALLLGHPGPPPASERTDETRARVSEVVPTSEPKST